MNKCKSGVYQIRNLVNNKIYIGSSKNIKKRFSEHKQNLKNGTHSNKLLLKDYKTHGLENFSFEVLKYTSEYRDLEYKYIKQHKEQDLYNIAGVEREYIQYLYDINNTNFVVDTKEIDTKENNIDYEKEKLKIDNQILKEYVEQVIKSKYDYLKSITQQLSYWRKQAFLYSLKYNSDLAELETLKFIQDFNNLYQQQQEEEIERYKHLTSMV